MIKLETKNCELCKSKFEFNPGNKRSSQKRFCSSFCAKKSNGLSNKGRSHTDEWKKMMSERNKGENNPFFGKKHKLESIKMMSKSSLWNESDYNYCNMSDVEKEIFDGILISDGSLSHSRISGRLTIGFKYIETIERIIKDLPSLSFLKPWKYDSKADKRTGKIYTSFYTKSNSFHDLLHEYNRWYKDGVKVIPTNVKITPLMCYWWFIGDGYNTDNNVYLCTDSFDRQSVMMINDKFIQNGFNTNVRHNNRISFDKKSSTIFLDWISKNIEIQKEYLYKWRK